MLASVRRMFPPGATVRTQIEGPMDQAQMSDIIEIEQLLAKYAAGMTRDDVESVMEVFTTDGWYTAFGENYSLVDFPRLVAAAPKGLFMTGTPALELNGDEASGIQPMCFVGQSDHHLRIGYWTDTFRRTDAGWRLATRSVTFLRKSGARDSGGSTIPLVRRRAPRRDVDQ